MDFPYMDFTFFKGLYGTYPLNWSYVVYRGMVYNPPQLYRNYTTIDHYTRIPQIQGPRPWKTPFFFSCPKLSIPTPPMKH